MSVFVWLFGVGTLILVATILILGDKLKRARNDVRWLKNKLAKLDEDEIEKRIFDEKKWLLVCLIGDALRDHGQKKLPLPCGIEDWIREYLSSGFCCGEVLFSAPYEWVRAHPKEAVGWYSDHVSPINQENRKILLRAHVNCLVK